MIVFWRKKEQSEKGLFKKLREGIAQSSNKISSGIADIFVKKKLDAGTLAELEELLIAADLGPATAAKLAAEISKDRFGKEVSIDEIKSALANEIEKILRPAEKQLATEGAKPFVILMVGVNGTGKTTTLGKWAYQFRQSGKQVMIAAGDTFRAAAVEQLKVWGVRAGCRVVAGEEGADAAALVYEAVDKAIADNSDILMIDTAGRLQNKANLMSELEKIIRVIRKKLPDAPHAAILVLEATVGQNAHSQVDLFKKTVNVTGLIVTKLDGTAKGGVLVSLVERLGLPVHAIGIGEAIGDLQLFKAREYARNLVGIPEL
ncbi:MAG: signal recognition particle-docking protein FtsY [Pseudomonadota bacterium]